MKHPDIRCLPLDSPRWAELDHAYGYASDIPVLLREVTATVLGSDLAKTWNDIWSALAHQGDVYTASFAAVPHVINALWTFPMSTDYNYLHFAAFVESRRQQLKVEVPSDLLQGYSAAIASLPALVAEAAVGDWSEYHLAGALAAIAAAKGSGLLAEVLLEMTPQVAEEFMDWRYSV
ncbi:hypothetical protein J1G33_20420 [Pseudomonas sp. P867]|uniref:hypothetical protein n=1 Tax=Pseudomonas sp. P867 TaxID=2816050 RepID=UPI001CA6F7B0|nr:hypothetical protein [Pseudomonas sp. P867]MBY8972758.1 hypothetical protein [Pseudomonas sp. P867]